MSENVLDKEIQNNHKVIKIQSQEITKNQNKMNQIQNKEEFLEQLNNQIQDTLLQINKIQQDIKLIKLNNKKKGTNLTIKSHKGINKQIDNEFVELNQHKIKKNYMIQRLEEIETQMNHIIDNNIKYEKKLKELENYAESLYQFDKQNEIRIKMEKIEKRYQTECIFLIKEKIFERAKDENEIKQLQIEIQHIKNTERQHIKNQEKAEESLAQTERQIKETLKVLNIRKEEQIKVAFSIKNKQKYKEDMKGQDYQIKSLHQNGNKFLEKDFNESQLINHQNKNIKMYNEVSRQNKNSIEYQDALSLNNHRLLSQGYDSGQRKFGNQPVDHNQALKKQQLSLRKSIAEKYTIHKPQQENNLNSRKSLKPQQQFQENSAIFEKENQTNDQQSLEEQNSLEQIQQLIVNINSPKSDTVNDSYYEKSLVNKQKEPVKTINVSFQDNKLNQSQIKDFNNNQNLQNQQNNNDQLIISQEKIIYNSSIQQDQSQKEISQEDQLLNNNQLQNLDQYDVDSKKNQLEKQMILQDDIEKNLINDQSNQESFIEEDDLLQNKEEKLMKQKEDHEKDLIYENLSEVEV